MITGKLVLVCGDADDGDDDTQEGQIFILHFGILSFSLTASRQACFAPHYNYAVTTLLQACPAQIMIPTS